MTEQEELEELAIDQAWDQYCQEQRWYEEQDKDDKWIQKMLDFKPQKSG